MTIPSYYGTLNQVAADIVKEHVMTNDDMANLLEDAISVYNTPVGRIAHAKLYVTITEVAKELRLRKNAVTSMPQYFQGGTNTAAYQTNTKE